MDSFFSSIWWYITAGEAGLLFRIMIPGVQAKRPPKFQDIYAFAVWSIFVVMSSILILRTDFLAILRTPLAAFFIGLAALEIWPALESTFDKVGMAIAKFLIRALPIDLEDSKNNDEKKETENA